MERIWFYTLGAVGNHRMVSTRKVSVTTFCRAPKPQRGGQTRGTNLCEVSLEAITGRRRWHCSSGWWQRMKEKKVEK